MPVTRGPGCHQGDHQSFFIAGDRQRLVPDRLPFRKDRSAATSMFAFLIAGFLFIGATGAILVAGTDLGTRTLDSGEAAGHQTSAASIATLLMESPGFGLDPDGDWVGGADDLIRLGLQNSTTDRLDFEKFENLAAAPLAVDATDGLVNYPEARESLGLAGEGLDFHVRAYPAIESVQVLLDKGIKDPNLRVAYVGHQEGSVSGGDPSDGLSVSFPNPCTTDGDDEWHLNAQINNGGTATTQFNVKFHAVLDGTAIDQTSNTFEVPAGSSATVTLEVPNTADVACTEGSTVAVEVWDPSNHLLDADTTLAASDVPSAPPNTSPRLLFSNPSKEYFADDEDVVIAYDGELEKNDELWLTIYKAGDLTTPIYETDPGTPHKVPQSQNHWKFDPIPASTFDPHGSKFWAYVSDGESLAGDRFLVQSPGPGDFSPSSGSVTYEWADSVAIEVGILNDLVEKFCPFEHDSKAANLTSEDPDWGPRCGTFQANPLPGDVFPDDKDVANTDLRDRLLDGSGNPRYDETNTLVVGSNVAHNSMTSNHIKDAIGLWVHGGGTLIVFGHDDKNVQWLQSIFHAGIESSSGGVTVPDGDHPILRVADALSPQDYDNHDKAWKFNSGTESLFTHIVLEDGEPTLTISNPGALTDGTVILTAWLPYDLFGSGADPDNLEAYALVNNFLMQGYRDLFLDYGPQIPDLASATPSLRTAAIDHPELGTLELTVKVWVFQGA